MGQYYIAVNTPKREYLDPGRIDGQGVKYAATICGNLGKLVVFKLVHGEWDSAEMVGDESSGDTYFDAMEGYRDITEETCARFNKLYKDGPGRIVYHAPKQ